MVEDETRVGMAIDQRRARFQIVPAQHVDRKVVAHGRARDPVEARVRAGRASSFVSMMRMPTAPGVFFHSATTSSTAGSSGSTGLTMADPVGMGPLHFDGIARVVAIHGERRK